MATPDGQLQVVFNGEIYNYPALRRELELAGHRFVSGADTEALLHGWRSWGTGLLDRLRGMFAFALHDAATGETFLARDPLGIKPLYWTDVGGRFAFASEVQALRSVLGTDALDAQGLASYLLWGSIAPPHTLYSGVRALPPGAWMRVASGRIEGPVQYYAAEKELTHAEPMSPDEASEMIRAALLDSARHHLLADVAVGAFLSGGVDSSALLGLLAECHQGPIRTVTLTFDVPELDESRLARLGAELYGSEHHEIPIRIEEIRDKMGDAVRALDQPSIDGINTFFVSEAAARAGLKVVISGIGGDELFGGYTSFARIPRIRRMHERLVAVPGLGRLIGPAARLLGGSRLHPRLSKLGRALAYGGDAVGAYFAERGLFSPHEVRELLAPELAESVAANDPRVVLSQRVCLNGLPEAEHVSALEIRQYLQVQLLRDTDATSMRHSLEVRTPLVDRELLRLAARVPPALRQEGPAKRRLREAPRPPLPPPLWQRRKSGFTLPFESWLRTGALPAKLPQHPWLRSQAVTAVDRDFRAGRVHWSRLWALVVLGHFLS
jgi:asparagine synthase (glutamine-hydrolysing)